MKKQLVCSGHVLFGSFSKRSQVKNTNPNVTCCFFFRQGFEADKKLSAIISSKLLVVSMVIKSPRLYINIPVLYKNRIVGFLPTNVYTLAFVPISIREVHSKLSTEK